MPIVTDGPVMEPENKGIDEFHVGTGASLAATARQTWEDAPVHQLLDINELGNAAAGPQPDFGEIGTGFPTTGPGIADDVKPAEPNIDMSDANDRVKKAGLAAQLKLPDQPEIPPAQLAIMMDRARRRQELEATIDRGPQGFIASALSVGTSFLVGAADPLNIASAFVPVMGELRYGKLLAAAGDSLASRLAVRAGVGAAEGAAGQAALEPLDWWSHTQDGRDFGMADVLRNLMFGAALGGGLHAGGGFISDAYRGAKGRPLYPFGPGEPLATPEGVVEPAPGATPSGSAGPMPSSPARAMEEAPQAEPERIPDQPIEGVPQPTEAETNIPENIPEAPVHEVSPPSLAVMTINDLPQRAHEDAMRGAIASLIEGEPVRSGEMLEAAARADPRIAESFEVPERQINPVARIPRGRAAADPQTWSLFEFLSHEGGLRPDPELNAVFGSAKGPFVPSFGPLVRPNGRTLDDALRLAKDHGYMFDAADVTGAEGRLTPNDLLDRLAEENSGRRQYRNDESFASKATDAAALEREKHEILTALHDEIESGTGVKGAHIDPRLEDRVVEIMTREGEHDVMAAFERAIMEDEERYNAETGQPASDQHPVAGRDVSDDARAASPGGAAAASQSLAAGNAGAGARDDAGGQPRNAGRGHGASPQAQLDRDAAWRQIAQAKPEFDDPDIVAASQEAAQVKPPPTKLDERVTAAEKAEAFAKQMYDMFAHRLPEGDRQRLDDLIKRIEDDHEAREIATVRGGSCLFGVV